MPFAAGSAGVGLAVRALHVDAGRQPPLPPPPDARLAHRSDDAGGGAAPRAAAVAGRRPELLPLRRGARELGQVRGLSSGPPHAQRIKMLGFCFHG